MLKNNSKAYNRQVLFEKQPFLIEDVKEFLFFAQDIHLARQLMYEEAQVFMVNQNISNYYIILTGNLKGAIVSKNKCTKIKSTELEKIEAFKQKYADELRIKTIFKSIDKQLDGLEAGNYGNSF